MKISRRKIDKSPVAWTNFATFLAVPVAYIMAKVLGLNFNHESVLQRCSVIGLMGYVIMHFTIRFSTTVSD